MMNRIDRIAPLIDALPDDIFEDFVAAAAHAASDETIYAKLSAAERATIARNPAAIAFDIASLLIHCLTKLNR